MSDFLRDYLTVGIFGLTGVTLVGLLLGLGSLLRPTRPQAEKYINYESGAIGKFFSKPSNNATIGFIAREYKS